MPWLMTIKRPGDFTTQAIISDVDPGLFVLTWEQCQEPWHIVFACQINEEIADVLAKEHGY